MIFDKYPREMGFPERKGKHRIVYNKKEFLEIVNLMNGKKNVYTSIYSFENTVENKYKIEIPEYESAVVNKLFFDLDSKNCLENTRKIHKWASQHTIKHTLIFSGGGFHIYVFTKEVRLNDKKSAIYNSQKYIADEVGLSIGEPKESDIDEHVVGDLARISRVPNTYNIKRKRFCIPITREDLELSFEEIREKAKQQNLIPVKIYGRELFDIKKFDYKNKKFDRGNIEIPEGNIEIKETDKFWKHFPPCIKTMITENKGHVARYWSCIFLKNHGFTEREAKQVFKKHQSKFLRPDETKNNYIHMQIHDSNFKTVWRGNGTHYFPDCKTIYNRKFCEGKCKWHQKMYVKRK